MDRDYHKPTLRKVSGKSSWYVYVTKPDSLRKNPTDRQVRKTTGTSDKRLAEKLMHSVAEKIYQEFDEQLQDDPFMAFIKKHWILAEAVDDLMAGPSPNILDDRSDAVDYRKIIVCEKVCYQSGTFDEALADKLFQFMNPNEARQWRNWVNAEVNPYPLPMQKQQTETEVAQEALRKVKDGAVINKTGAPRLSEFYDEYASDTHRWKTMTNKETKAQLERLKSVIKLLEDIPVDQVMKHHGLIVAETLEEDGKANATIKAWVQSLRAYLEWISTRPLNTYTNPPTPWIKSNVLYGLSLKNYGVKKRSYEAFTTDQLHHLFSLEMPENDRLLLSIMITTGMRLDEAALLTWDQFKVDRNGLRYFDLSLGAIVKNDKFSARTVAIPDCLKLPKRAQGRLFNFPIDEDGKSSREASKHLRQYTHAVRFDENDDRKVVHSLRHNLSGLLTNLQPTPSSEIMDWITGHGMEGKKTQSERTKTYGIDPDVSVKYAAVNRVEHPWLS